MVFKGRQNYEAPKKLREWINDIADGELYQIFVSSDNKVWCTSGRVAHSSAAASTSWGGFLGGELNELVLKTMGQEVLNEVTSYLEQKNT
ncbi:hypothetical protein [Pseudoalteromonas prydzensis]|uniref:hypothetical protein n=1 Tax=Pseudoalteromonas prydzensis TaxID=182141 RepID=UPI0037042D91